MLFLAMSVSPLIIAFALGGLFVSVFYVAPPLRLKHHGLGEPGVFIVWGPLMIGGTFLAATGTVPAWVLVFSLPYALLVTSVLFGKHIDKIEPDDEPWHPDAAGHPRRGAGAGRRTVADDPLLPARRAGRADRLGRAVGPAHRARPPAPHERSAEGRSGRPKPANVHRRAPSGGAGLAALVRRPRKYAFIGHSRRRAGGYADRSVCCSTPSCRSGCPGSAEPTALQRAPEAEI